MSRQPHFLVIPFPVHGHVAPLMNELGIKVPFVYTEFIHAKILASTQEKAEDSSSRITLVSIADGLEQGDDRKDPHKMTQSVASVMPGCLKNLIEKIYLSNDCEPIRCVVADLSVGWALEVAEQMGIARAAVLPYGPGSLALSLHIPKLLEDGIIDANGFTVLNDELISLSHEILARKRY